MTWSNISVLISSALVKTLIEDIGGHKIEHRRQFYYSPLQGETTQYDFLASVHPELFEGEHKRIVQAYSRYHFRLFDGVNWDEIHISSHGVEKSSPRGYVRA